MRKTFAARSVTILGPMEQHIQEIGNYAKLQESLLWTSKLDYT